MDPLPTLDALLAQPKPDPDRLRRTAERSVAAAISDWQAIRAFDLATGTLDPRAFHRPTATAVRAEYEAWTAAAAALASRVRAIASRFGPVAAAEELGYTRGKSGAQLSISLDAMDDTAQAYAEGRIAPSKSAEEVRRELQLHPGVRAAGLG